MATGPSSRPLSWTHVVPVISPLPFSVNHAANTGSGFALPRGCTTVTPVRTGPVPTTSLPLPDTSVVWPTSTPATSVIASRAPGVPPIGRARSRSRGFCACRAPGTARTATNATASAGKRMSVAPCRNRGANRAARPRRRDVAAVDDDHSADDHERNALRGNRSIFVRRAVDDRRRIEDRQVGVGAGLDAALLRHHRRAWFKAPRRVERHAPERVHQRDDFLFAHVLSENLRIRSRRAWMAAAVFDEPVAGDHGERAGDGRSRLFLAPAMDDDSAACRPGFPERRARQALAGRYELVLRETRVRPGLPVVEQRRLDFRHAGAVRIRLRRDVLSAVARGL